MENILPAIKTNNLTIAKSFKLNVFEDLCLKCSEFGRITKAVLA